jgi:hypothetical protein
MSLAILRADLFRVRVTDPKACRLEHLRQTSEDVCMFEEHGVRLQPSNINAGLRFKIRFRFRCLRESALEPKADLKEVNGHFRNVPTH